MFRTARILTAILTAAIATPAVAQHTRPAAGPAPSHKTTTTTHNTHSNHPPTVTLHSNGNHNTHSQLNSGNHHSSTKPNTTLPNGGQPGFPLSGNLNNGGGKTIPGTTPPNGGGKPAFPLSGNGGMAGNPHNGNPHNGNPHNGGGKPHPGVWKPTKVTIVVNGTPPLFVPGRPYVEPAVVVPGSVVPTTTVYPATTVVTEPVTTPVSSVVQTPPAASETPVVQETPPMAETPAVLGVVLTKNPDGAAAAAKLKANDVIMSFGGVRTETPEALDAAAKKFVGQKVVVVYLDGATGEEKPAFVTPAADGTLGATVAQVRVQ